MSCLVLMQLGESRLCDIAAAQIAPSPAFVVCDAMAAAAAVIAATHSGLECVLSTPVDASTASTASASGSDTMAASNSA